MSMNRLTAGLASGAVGAVLSIALSFVQIPVVGLLIPILVGIAAGVFVSKNPAYASKTGHAGALAGLTAGVVLFVAAIIGSIIVINSPTGQSIINAAAATATVQAGSSGSTGGSNVDLRTITQVAAVLGGCIGGLLYLGIATGIGAAAGAIAGRNNVAAPVNPYGQYGAMPPYGMPPMQPGYPPAQQPPASPYGSQQPPTYTPPPSDVPPGSTPPPGYPPQNDGTQ